MELNLSLRHSYRILRNQKKIKLKALAEIIGVSVPMLSMYENEIVNLQKDKEQKYRSFIITLTE
ncbi:helix-turn-helix domain-containing protein [Paenibacillus allorhizosphaerae]|uniref:HTH cro/C1-type domain-containing protein n=1 Tax=Paenibacillus allorhizosphaerae TaxID=2849866 RepID=A0ABM8VL89_9BACL|nr:helix-turn-helix transcriptional regulator [Paenibacillus allorhizosphaerae]CAG7648148.1 hypothetical protein PAECIP111802_04137 [Paenibacillus allorhizosphaerae]